MNENALALDGYIARSDGAVDFLVAVQEGTTSYVFSRGALHAAPES
jgi:hypothetical protein